MDNGILEKRHIETFETLRKVLEKRLVDKIRNEEVGSTTTCQRGKEKLWNILFKEDKD